MGMRKATISKRWQVTIPVAFREKLLPTQRREVVIEQLPDGTVQLRPIRSIMELAGCLKPRRRVPALTEREMRKAVENAVVKAYLAKQRRRG